MTRYGISAAAIVVEDNQLLLVHHQFDDGEDFWVPPGGSLEGTESIMDCAVREAWEETNLRVQPEKILYVEDFIDGDYRFTKFFIVCSRISGEITLENLTEDHVTDARFMSRSMMAGVKIFPAVLVDTFWEDVENGFDQTRYLGLSHL